jgi:hypothetical protein
MSKRHGIGQGWGKGHTSMHPYICREGLYSGNALDLYLRGAGFEFHILEVLSSDLSFRRCLH